MQRLTKMLQPYSLGFSTCPNDTFIFHAMTQGEIDCGDLQFEPVLRDVEALNQAAKSEALDITKLSFAALAHLHKSYGLLHSGAALGRGCGPLIVARPGYPLSQLSTSSVAVPGVWTTANLLLGLYLSGAPKVVSMPFDRIMPAIADGNCDYGVIIHEGRFTYESYNLVALLDLGQWWEDATGLPIPLGGIAVRRSLGPVVAEIMEKIIRASVRYAFNHPEASRAYVKQHAQEMDDDIISQHIALYVNDDSLSLSAEGQNAIRTLFSRGRQLNLLPKSPQPLFAT